MSQTTEIDRQGQSISRRWKQTRAEVRLIEMLEERGKPIINAREFFRLIQCMYTESRVRKLYLRKQQATVDDYGRFRSRLLFANAIRVDHDYRSRLRILAVPDLPADDIVCLADPFCHVSHLSAMQRWGFTNRRPKALVITRPDDRIIKLRMMEVEADEGSVPLPPRNVHHPAVVRKRPIQVHSTKRPTSFVQDRNSFTRVSTVGQAFLDTLLKPDLCGGMPHVLDVWQEHAARHFDTIVEAVEDCGSPIIKCRAGYILEERLEMQNPQVVAWKAFAQRGGSRRLDPSKQFSSGHSETWMISINA